MSTQPDFFPDIPRNLSREEAAQAFDELLRTVGRMTFAADEMRKLSRDNHRPWSFGAKHEQSAGGQFRHVGENPFKS